MTPACWDGVPVVVHGPIDGRYLVLARGRPGERDVGCWVEATSREDALAKLVATLNEAIDTKRDA